MRQFFLTFPKDNIFQSVIEESAAASAEAANQAILQSPIEESLPRSMAISPKVNGLLGRLEQQARALPLPWTHYFRLLRVRNALAREFYAREALAGGWSVRQFARQRRLRIGTNGFAWTCYSSTADYANYNCQTPARRR